MGIFPLKSKFFYTVLFLFSLALGYFLLLTFAFVPMGIDVDKTKEGWEVRNVESSNPTIESGVREGDLILEIDGKRPEEMKTMESWRSISTFEEIVVNRDGEPLTLHASRRYFWIDFHYVYSLFSVLMLIFAVYIYNKVNTSSAQILSFVFINMAAIFMSLGASARGSGLGKAILFTGLMLFPILFIHFLIRIFSEKGYDFPGVKYVKWLYMIVAAVAVPIFISFICEGKYTYPLYLFFTKVTIVITLILFLISLLFLGYVSWKQTKYNELLGVITKTLWFSIFISCAPIALFAFIPRIIWGEEAANSFVMGWFTLLFPLSLVYLIAKNQLYDIGLITRRLLLTTTISIFPSLVIVLTVTVLFPGDDPLNRAILLFFISVCMITFVLYSLEYVTTRFEAIMFPRKYVLQNSIKKIARDLSKINNFRELKDMVLLDIVNTLEVFGGAIVFHAKDTFEWIVEGDIDEDEAKSLILKGTTTSSNYTCLEINRNEQYTSYLIFTKKRSHAVLGKEEREWLNMLISYLAVSLENLHLIRKLTIRLQQLAAQAPDERSASELNWFRKLMFELQEEERVRIATDLHDTTMQDLFFLKQKLSALLSRVTLTLEDAKLADNLLEYIDIINTNLRQSCFELHPHLLEEIGLAETIRKVVDRERIVSAFEIGYEYYGKPWIELHGIETKRHLFRAVQELINNAKKHSYAKQVRIYLSATEEGLQLEYVDDGVGFLAGENRSNRDIGDSGMGLEQLRSRILYLKGQMEIETSPGQGVQCVITVPLQKGLSA
ncbi:ATP-binding protein [Marinicrinis lubricantis]|uniref:histidine kinase n=1 Tax=Marinicrinis lubricantis TaxID=2086470 RepID=A0ABW1IJ82_9BACL